MHEISVEIGNEISEIPKVGEAFDRFSEASGLAPAMVQTFRIVFDCHVAAHASLRVAHIVGAFVAVIFALDSLAQRDVNARLT